MASEELYKPSEDSSTGVVERLTDYLANDLTRNLFDYNDTGLEEIDLEGSRYRTNPEFEPEIILAQAFGADYDDESYNQKLADTVTDARDYFGQDIIVLAQAEIATLLKENGEENIYSIGKVYHEDEDTAAVSKYTTKEIMDHNFEKIKDQDLDPEAALYVSHPAHTERVIQVGEKSGLDGEPFILDEVEWPSNDSKQWWVRSPYRWAPREVIARIHHKVAGQM